MAGALDIFDRIAVVHRGIRLLAEYGDPQVVAVLADALDRSIAPGATGTFETEMGLPPKWRSDYRRLSRDAALKRLRARHFPLLMGQHAARAVASAVKRYRTTSWPRDHRSHRRPLGLRGDCYDVLEWGEEPGDETLRRLFAADRLVKCSGGDYQTGSPQSAA